jgi:hypothetical protein
MLLSVIVLDDFSRGQDDFGNAPIKGDTVNSPSEEQHGIHSVLLPPSTEELRGRDDALGRHAVKLHIGGD